MRSLSAADGPQLGNAPQLRTAPCPSRGSAVRRDSIRFLR